MLRDHRPYRVKKAYLRLQNFYVEHFLRPQFTSLGGGHTFIRPWDVEVFGEPIEVGDFVNVIASRDRKVRLTVWSDRENPAGIRIGNYCLICPGVRLSAATGIAVGDNVMFAYGAYVTDSDWHGIYDRVAIVGKSAPVHIENNAWIGDSVIVCKGVTIGENSVIGAGSVVTSSIPANTIAAGNPARVVKPLDPDRKIRTRAEWFADPKALFEEIDRIDRQKLAGNTFLDWVRSSVFPKKGD
jgi:acetyltransferase-like isoleucine patch superfamily enzyme